MTLEKTLAKKLTIRKQTLSLAESCTGGLLSHRLTQVPGSSRFFMLGIVCYSNRAKINVLGVSKVSLNAHGAVSKEVAVQMARNIRKCLGTDYGISLTGIAGPNGGTKKKPVGLTFICVSKKTETICRKFVFKGTRASIKKQACEKAITMLLRTIPS